MKKRNRVLALAIAVAMFATGCASDSTDGVSELLARSGETMAGVTNYSAVMDMDLVMSMMGDEVSSTTTAEVITFADPLKMKMDMTMEISGAGSQDIKMYVQEVDGELVSYMHMEGMGWIAAGVDMASMGQYNAVDNATMYLNVMSDVKENGTEDINGVKTTRIDGVISGEGMKDAAIASGVMSSVESMGLTEEEVLKIYEAMGGMPISMWISEDGYVYKYEFDMSEMMKQVMDQMLAELGAVEGMDLVISRAVVSMTCDDFNTAEDFEIPDEALNAEVMSY